MQEIDDDASVGTHVNLRSSILRASLSDVNLLQDPKELTFEDFAYLTQADVNKLNGQGPKRSKAPKQLKAIEPKSSFAEKSMSTILNLDDALKCFDLDKNGRLDEREQSKLYRM